MGGQVRPIMGGKPPQTPHNTIPPRTAIFVTQSPRFARGLDNEMVARVEDGMFRNTKFTKYTLDIFHLVDEMH